MSSKPLSMACRNSMPRPSRCSYHTGRLAQFGKGLTETAASQVCQALDNTLTHTVRRWIYPSERNGLAARSPCCPGSLYYGRVSPVAASSMLANNSATTSARSSGESFKASRSKVCERSRTAAQQGNGAESARRGFVVPERNGPRRLRLIASPLGGRE